MGLSGRLMDKKVSVSQFLRAAPGARPRSRPKAKAAPSPPPPPRPRPAPAAPSGPPKDWRALAGGRSGPWWLLPAAILSVLTIFGIVGAALPTKQPPVPFVIELTAAERSAIERSEAEHAHRNTDMCENYVTEGQRAAAKKLIGLHGYDCRTIDQMCPYIMSEGFQVACNDYRYLFELENHGGIWSVKAD
jgi:hypothetical protein